MRVEATICDRCGRTKGAGNHWFQAALADDAIHIYLHGTGLPSCADLCGEECLHLWITINLPIKKETNAESKPTATS